MEQIEEGTATVHEQNWEEEQSYKKWRVQFKEILLI